MGQQYASSYQGCTDKAVITADQNNSVEGTFEFVEKINNSLGSKNVINGKFKVNLE